jgi:sporulation protein YlmC with PRC-barrel domain
MLRKLMVSTALAGLLIATASAQTTPPTQAAPGGGAKVIGSQTPDQWLATKFKGTSVIGPNNEKIGDVSDVLFDQNGQIQAYVVSVGGFLGLGAKEVALAPSSFQVMKGQPGDYDRLKLSMSKEELQQAQNFEPYQPPRATTGAGGAGGGLGGRPVGGPSPSR